MYNIPNPPKIAFFLNFYFFISEIQFNSRNWRDRPGGETVFASFIESFIVPIKD